MFNSSPTGAAFGGVSAGTTGGDVLQGMGMDAAAWAAGEVGNMLIGHAAGFIATGMEPPTYSTGSFVYDAGSDGWITFSKVMVGPKDDLQ